MEKTAGISKTVRRNLIDNEDFTAEERPVRTVRTYKDITLRTYDNFTHIILNPSSTLICNSIGHQVNPQSKNK